MYKVTAMTDLIQLSNEVDGTFHCPRIGDGTYTFSWMLSQGTENLPSNPNLIVFECDCEEADVAVLEADINYEVLSSEEVQNEL